MARRQHDLAVVGEHGTLREAVDGLLDDPDGLAHLLDAAAEAVPAVADRPDRDVELEVAVCEAGIDLAEVPRLAGRAEERPGDAERLEALAIDDADALGALEEDLVLGEERLELIDAGGELGAERLDLRSKPTGMSSKTPPTWK